jgi:hypothetical protein
LQTQFVFCCPLSFLFSFFFCFRVLIYLPSLQQRFACAVAFWLAVDGRPMKTESTRTFAEVRACAGFQPPSRDNITGLITDDLTPEADMSMMESLAGTATLSIVIDSWTSSSGTAHF